MSYNGPLPQVVKAGGTGAATLTGVVSGNGTSALTASALTQHAVLIGGASNAITSVADVAVGSVLVSGGVSSDPSFALNSSVGTWVLIAQNLPSGVASSTFSSLTTTYNTYILVTTNLTGTATGSMKIQINTGSGAITSGYLGGMNTNPYNSTTLTNTAITAGLMIAPYGATTQFIDSVTYICNLTSGTNNVQAYGQASIFDSTGPALTMGISTSSYDTASQVVTSIIINNTSGNITGTLTLYGLLE